MTTDNNFRVKNGVVVGNGSVASNSPLNLTGPTIGIVSTSTQDIDLYTNNFTANGVEVWLRHNDGVEINTDNGGKSWKFFPEGNTRFATILALDTTSLTTGSGLLAVIADGGSKLAYYSTTACNWLYVGTEEVVYTPSSSPPVTDYIGWYDASSFAGSTWNDRSIYANDATVTGSASVVTVGAGYGSSTGVSTVQGSPSAYVNFGTMPGTYTLFTVARLPDSATNAGWMFTQNGGNTWLHGFAGTYSGTAYHEGFVNTFPPSPNYTDNWLISSDQNYFYRPNGNTSAQGTSGGGASPAGSWGVNMRYSGSGFSDGLTTNWQCAEIIVYDRTLSGTEISDTESYLAGKYGITLGV